MAVTRLFHAHLDGAHRLQHLVDRLDALILGGEVGALRSLDATEEEDVDAHEREHREEAREDGDVEQLVEHRHRDDDLELRRPEQILQVGDEHCDRLDVDGNEVDLPPGDVTRQLHGSYTEMRLISYQLTTRADNTR